MLSESLAFQFLVKNLPGALLLIATALGVSPEQVKLHILTGVTSAVVFMSLWVSIKLFVWCISKTGLLNIAAVITRKLVLQLVGFAVVLLAYEFCTLQNILWIWYEARTCLMKHGILPAPGTQTADFVA